MDGYYTSYGYMGLVNGNRMLFATETEYEEYLKEWKTHVDSYLLNVVLKILLQNANSSTILHPQDRGAVVLSYQWDLEIMLLHKIDLLSVPQGN